VGDDFDWDVNHSVDNLKDFLNMVNISNSFFEFLKNHSPLHNFLNFSHSFVFISNFNDLFVFLDYLFDSLHNDWNLNNLLNNILDVFVDIDELRNNLLDFNDSWNFHKFLFKALYFINLGDND
jgi:hypothetical protein